MERPRERERQANIADAEMNDDGDGGTRPRGDGTRCEDDTFGRDGARGERRAGSSASREQTPWGADHLLRAANL